MNILKKLREAKEQTFYGSGKTLLIYIVKYKFIQIGKFRKVNQKPCCYMCVFGCLEGIHARKIEMYVFERTPGP